MSLVAEIKSKSFQKYCVRCNTTTEMRYLSESEELGIVWLKCRHCHLCYHFKPEELMDDDNESERW